MRLTAAVLEQVLAMNEGFSWSTSYTSKNHSYSRTYRIDGGELHIREVGKTSWADSRYDNNWVADLADARRIIRDNLNRLRLPE